MPWKNPEKPPLVFQDSWDERRWWNRSIFKLPFRKFKGLDEATVWGPLYQRFNTAPMPILDMEAWHADVVELMRKSATVKELYKCLEERQKQRFDELSATINKMDGGVEWFCQPREKSVKSLGISLFHLWRDPSLFETARVFQTMTDITDQAERERRRERRAERKQCREKRQERRLKREQRKKERRARSSLEVDTISARLSPPLSNGSPPPADQPREGDDYLRGGKRKRSHSEQDAANDCKKKRRVAAPSASLPELPKDPEPSPSTGPPKRNAGGILNNGSDPNTNKSRKRKRDTCEFKAEGGREEKRRAGPPRTSQEEATSPRSSTATSTSSDAGYVSNNGSDSYARRSRQRKCDTQDSEAESGREAKRGAAIPFADPMKEPTSPGVSSTTVSTVGDEGYEADSQESCPARTESKTRLSKRKLKNRKCNNREHVDQNSEAVGANEEDFLSTTPQANPTEGPTSPSSSSTATSTSRDKNPDSNDHGSFKGKTTRKMKPIKRKRITRKRTHRVSDAKGGHKGKLPAASPRASPPEEPVDSDAPSSILSLSSDEDDGPSDIDADSNANAIEKRRARDGYPTPPGMGSSETGGHAPYEDEFPDCCRGRAEHIHYEQLGWVRDYGPADRELCSHAHEEAQLTKPLTGDEGRF